MGRQFFQRFLLRDRGPASHAGQDEGLGDAGQRELRIQGGRRAEHAGDTGGDIVADALFVERIHLFPDGSVHAGVSGVEADRRVVHRLLLFHDGQDFFEGHGGTIIDRAPFPGTQQVFRVHKASRIDDAVRLFEELRAPQRDEVFRSGSGSDKMDHVVSSAGLTMRTVK